MNKRNVALFDQVLRRTENDAKARQVIAAVRNRAQSGALSGADLAAVANTLRAGKANAADVQILLTQIAVNQQLQLWLLNGKNGTTDVPRGPRVPIALVPGMPRGQIVPTGFGPVLIGVDQLRNAVVLGQGDVQQVATEVDDPSFGLGEVTLANPTSTAVNYTVNQTAYGMAPTFTQSLPGGRAWVVAFDRGKNNGTAEYQLTEGYYEFEITPQGWELYKKEQPTSAANAVALITPSVEPSPYVESVAVGLPKGFKLFDAQSALMPAAEPVAARLPEHFTLFSDAANQLAQSAAARN